MNDVKPTPDTEVNVPATSEAVVQPEQKEETVSEMLGNSQTSESVPLNKFLNEKKQRKELEKRIKELEESKTKDVSEGVKSLAEKHNLDVSVVEDLVGAIRSEATAEFDDKLKPILEKERKAKFESAFNDMYQKAIDRNPQYKDIAKKSVIKALSLDPSNANKTFSNLMEENFGHLIEKKKSFESGSQGVNSMEETSVDFEKAQQGGEYYDKVMANPKLKEEYSAKLLKLLTE